MGEGRWLSAVIAITAAAMAMSGCASSAPSQVVSQTSRFDRIIDLDPADTSGDVALEEVLDSRRSGRSFAGSSVSLDVLGQLLWAGQGVTDAQGHRTAPSAGARYPIELYAITADEVMRYRPNSHQVDVRSDARVLGGLAELAFGQSFVSAAPLVIAVIAEPARTAAEYGAAAEPLVDRESGHVAQNILLQATALGLSSVPVGGFDPHAIAELLALPPGQDVRYLIPVG